jgi:hypothetical protein
MNPNARRQLKDIQVRADLETVSLGCFQLPSGVSLRTPRFETVSLGCFYYESKRKKATQRHSGKS